MLYPGQLHESVLRVRRELKRLGLWTQRCEIVTVSLAPISNYEGWYHEGEIFIPVFELHPLRWTRPRTYLRDTLRHEYGHALADLHSGLIRKLRFATVFGAGYNNLHVSFKYDPEFHVSTYAAKHAREDFAETFAQFVKHSGRLPRRYDTPAIRDKWRFIEKFRALLKEVS